MSVNRAITVDGEVTFSAIAAYNGYLQVILVEN